MWADERFLLLHLRGPQSSSQGSEGFRGHLGAGPQPLAGVAVLMLTMALRVKTELIVLLWGLQQCTLEEATGLGYSSGV